MDKNFIEEEKQLNYVLQRIEEVYEPINYSKGYR